MDGFEIEAQTIGSAMGPLLDRVALGEEITIRRFGKAVARLIPIAETIDRERHRDAVAELSAISSELAAGDLFTLDEIRSWREFGRR